MPIFRRPSDDFLVREVHKAAGKFGRIFVRRNGLRGNQTSGAPRLDEPNSLVDFHTGNGTDMWMKDQYLDILFRWLYLPLYILFASFSLNF